MCNNSVAVGGSASTNITEPPATTNPSHQPVFLSISPTLVNIYVSLSPSDLFDGDLGVDLTPLQLPRDLPLSPSPVPFPTRPPAENAHPRPTETRPSPAKRAKIDAELERLQVQVVDSVIVVPVPVFNAAG